MPKEADVFSDDNLVPNNWIKWTEIGDNIIGTLTAVRTGSSTLPGHEGEATQIYEFKAQSGEFHDVDEKKRTIEEPITLKPGETWNVGGRFMIDSQMKNIKLGQIIGMKFMEEKPNKQKGFNAMKIIKVFAPKNADGTPKMDEEWLTEFNLWNPKNTAPTEEKPAK